MTEHGIATASVAEAGVKGAVPPRRRSGLPKKRTNLPVHENSGIAFSWNSELPSGHNPFWIRDEGLSGLGLHTGDAVAIDTRAEPRNGDLVVVEAEIDGDSVRLARRYFQDGDRVHLEPTAGDKLTLPQDSVLVLGIIVARLRFTAGATDPPVEEPL